MRRGHIVSIKPCIISILVRLFPLVLSIVLTASGWTERTDISPDDHIDFAAAMEVEEQEVQFGQTHTDSLIALSFAWSSEFFWDTPFSLEFSQTPILSKQPSRLSLRI